MEELISGRPLLIRHFTLDMTFGKIYWSESGGSVSSLLRADWDGSHVEYVVPSSALIAGVHVEPVMGKLYWGMYDRIMRADRDGGNSEVVFETDGLDAQYLFVDWNGGKVYWAGMHPRHLARANLV